MPWCPACHDEIARSRDAVQHEECGAVLHEFCIPAHVCAAGQPKPKRRRPRRRKKKSARGPLPPRAGLLEEFVTPSGEGSESGPVEALDHSPIGPPGPALDVIEGLVLPDGRRFADAAAEFQARDFRAVLASDCPPNVWISRPRGGSKTTDTAALALAELLFAPPWSQSFACAADQDQARLLRDAVERWVSETPSLHGSFDIQRDQVVNVATGARLRVLASDAPSALGLTPWRVYCDELAAWPTGALWGAMFSASHKVAGCRVFVLTTAGAPSSWSFDLFKTVQTSPRWLVLHSDEIAPWIDSEAVEDARRLLPDGLFARYYGNRWSAGDECPFTLEQVDHATDYGREPASSGDGRSSYLVGCDYGRVNDAAVVAVVRQDPTRQAHQLVHLWHRTGSRSSPVLVRDYEDAIFSVQRRFWPCRVLADPWQLAGTIERLNLEPFNFTGQSKSAMSATFVGLIREGRLRLLDDARLRSELLNLTVKEGAHGWTIEAARGHDDLAVAVAIAASQADAAPPRQAWVYTSSA